MIDLKGNPIIGKKLRPRRKKITVKHYLHPDNPLCAMEIEITLLIVSRYM
jgi:hypothetical protein